MIWCVLCLCLAIFFAKIRLGICCSIFRTRLAAISSKCKYNRQKNNANKTKKEESVENSMYKHNKCY